MKMWSYLLIGLAVRVDIHDSQVVRRTSTRLDADYVEDFLTGPLDFGVEGGPISRPRRAKGTGFATARVVR